MSKSLFIDRLQSINIISLINRWGGNVVFTGGLAIYLATMVLWVGIPYLERSLPIEADDGYTYIMKAVQMKYCLFSECPALSELRLQLQEPTENYDKAMARYREHVRALILVYPLHAGILASFETLGLTWEQSYGFVLL
jgi:hypothetical protein